ncbi:hypothetical protein IC006_0106 [Sulfuracidifex tepidarius]|uniref:Glycosyltransferase 2-like domain-containing protein n=1 Tax=Sulfuracidifex tepidarius TaxID=1294262 RepID=A0A510DRP1_9CREN|nr:hypothetical protein [Sulfuracidifex tepidarius]BBG22822.1 hypothetical protein IC006_0106 [Sulfuracidifex tepidarius]
MTGVEALDTDLISFLDDDDIFMPCKVRVVKEIFNERPYLTGVHNFQKFITPTGAEINKPFNNTLVKQYVKLQPSRDVEINKDNALSLYKKYPSIHHNNSSFTVRRYLIEKYRDLFVNLSLILDLLLYFITAKEGLFYNFLGH